MRLLGAIGLIVALLAGGAPADAQPGAANVVVAEVIEREVVGSHTFVGSVMPARISKVGSAVDGRVVEYPINLGDRVEKSQPLAQLLRRQLEIALSAAEDELEARKAEFEELKRGRPEEIDQAKARQQGLEAARKYALSRLDRFRRAAEKGVYTEDQIEEITSAAIQADKAYLESKLALDILEKGARPEVLAQHTARIAVQEQEVERIKDLLEKHTIRAPFNGYVVAEHTEAGEMVMSGGLVATIVELDQVDIEVPVLENYISNLKIGDQANVEITSLPDNPLVGQVAQIVPLADARSRNFPVRVRLQNPLKDGLPLIKAGMFARVSLAVGKPIVAPIVPKDAIVLGGPTPVVAVVDRAAGGKAGKIRMVPVQLGMAQGPLMQVQGELKPGELVVVQGNERLRPGQDVAIVRQEPTTPATAANR